MEWDLWSINSYNNSSNERLNFLRDLDANISGKSNSSMINTCAKNCFGQFSAFFYSDLAIISSSILTLTHEIDRLAIDSDTDKLIRGAWKALNLLMNNAEGEERSLLAAELDSIQALHHLYTQKILLKEVLNSHPELNDKKFIQLLDQFSMLIGKHEKLDRQALLALGKLYKVEPKLLKGLIKSASSVAKDFHATLRSGYPLGANYQSSSVYGQLYAYLSGIKNSKVTLSLLSSEAKALKQLLAIIEQRAYPRDFSLHLNLISPAFLPDQGSERLKIALKENEKEIEKINKKLQQLEVEEDKIMIERDEIKQLVIELEDATNDEEEILKIEHEIERLANGISQAIQLAYPEEVVDEMKKELNQLKFFHQLAISPDSLTNLRLKLADLEEIIALKANPPAIEALKEIKNQLENSKGYLKNEKTGLYEKAVWDSSMKDGDRFRKLTRTIGLISQDGYKEEFQVDLDLSFLKNHHPSVEQRKQVVQFLRYCDTAVDNNPSLIHSISELDKLEKLDKIDSQAAEKLKKFDWLSEQEKVEFFKTCLQFAVNERYGLSYLYSMM
jgi:hypothetical protein